MALSTYVANMASYSPKRKTTTTGITGDATAFNWGGTTATAPSGSGGLLNQPLGGPGIQFNAAPPPPERLPWDIKYEGDVSQINASRTGAYGMLDSEENALGLDFGVQFDRKDVDLNGDKIPDAKQLTNYRIADNVDVTNPYSRAAALKKSWQQNKTGNTNSYASRGQLYSGALNRAQNTADGQYGEGKDALLKGFGSGARDIFNRRFQTWNSAESSIRDALERRLQTSLANPLPSAPQAPAAPAPTQAPQNQLGALIQKYGGQNVKWTENGLFYKRSDGKWIPIKQPGVSP